MYIIPSTHPLRRTTRRGRIAPLRVKELPHAAPAKPRHRLVAVLDGRERMFIMARRRQCLQDVKSVERREGADGGRVVEESRDQPCGLLGRRDPGVDGVCCPVEAVPRMPRLTQRRLRPHFGGERGAGRPELSGFARLSHGGQRSRGLSVALDDEGREGMVWFPTCGVGEGAADASAVIPSYEGVVAGLVEARVEERRLSPSNRMDGIKSLSGSYVRRPAALMD